MSPVVVLVGPPGSGKSTVGRLLAAKLGVDFRDTDADVEIRTGTTISEIFVDHGEARFRELEKEAVRTALQEHEGVLALGGGAILDPETRALLAAEPVAFLDVTAADAASRVGLNRDRPLLVGNIRGQLSKLMAGRRPLYEEVASMTLAADRAAEEIAAELAETLGVQA